MPRRSKNEDLVHNAILTVAEAVHEEATQERAMLPPDAHKKKIAHELEAHIKQVQKKIQEGLDCCIAGVQDKKAVDEIQNTVIAPIANLTPDEMSDAGKKLLDDISWKEQFKISDATMQQLFNAAKTLFKKQDFRHAENAFFCLATLDPKEFSFWIGLGHASSKLHHFEQAINAYAMASMIDSQNPWPHIWVGNAFLENKDKASAKLAFDAALPLTSSDQKLAQTIREKLQKCSSK